MSLADVAVICLTLLSSGVPPSTAHRLYRVPVREVKLGGEWGRRVDVTVQNNVLRIAVDEQFLEPFRRRSSAGGYIGLGKLIDATVRFAAYQPSPALNDLRRKLVEETLRLQEEDGYVGMMRPDARLVSLWDIHEMSYIAYGLLTNYRLFDDPASLQAARRIADHILDGWERVEAAWHQPPVSIDLAVTSLERTLVALWKLTGERRYLTYCLTKRKLTVPRPIELGRRPGIRGHIYAYLCRALAAAELYAEQPNSRLLVPFQRASRFLLQEGGLTVTGAAGQWECWTNDQDGADALGETCATAYQLRMWDYLLRLTGDPLYADIIERTVYNALFAAQSPDGRQIRYYTPFEGPRKYYPADTYCCPGNYRRIVSELPQFVYYRHARGVVVAQYGSSTWQGEIPGAGRVELEQRTEFPSDGRVELDVRVASPAEFEIWLRIPRWAEEATVRVRGTSLTARGGSFLKLRRLWENGDRVVIDLPMRWRWIRGFRQQAGRVALARGPLLFCLNPERNPQVREWNVSKLLRIVPDLRSLSEPIPDNSVRPNGVAVKLRAWSPGYRVDPPGDLELTLTEFPDPGGVTIYLRHPSAEGTVADELLGCQHPVGPPLQEGHPW